MTTDAGKKPGGFWSEHGEKIFGAMFSVALGGVVYWVNQTDKGIDKANVSIKELGDATAKAIKELGDAASGRAERLSDRVKDIEVKMSNLDARLVNVEKSTDEAKDKLDRIEILLRDRLPKPKGDN